MNVLAVMEILAQEAPKGGGGGGWQPLIMIGLMFVVMWVIIIRPQQKRQKELNQKIEALKKGDKVVTIGGLHGVVNHISKKGTISLRVSDGIFLTFDKKSVATILNDKPKEEGKEEKKDKQEDEEEKGE